MFQAALLVIFTLIAAPAFAQTYVGAAVGMDISRFDRVEAQGANDFNAGGEALAFSLRLGTAVGQNWGVELGFTRPNEVERESTIGYPIPLLAAAGVPLATAANVIAPIFESSTRLERRETTLDTVAWVAQPVGSRITLAYLGGVAFNRTVEDVSFQFNRRVGGIVIPNSVRTISYGVSPIAGLDARINLTEHVRLVPGMRIQSASGSAGDGWLIRMSAGLAWQF